MDMCVAAGLRSDMQCVIYLLHLFISFAGTDAQGELRVQVFLHSYGCQDPVTQHLSNKLELSDPALLPSALELELQCPPSPAYREFSSSTIHTTNYDDNMKLFFFFLCN